MKKIKIKDFTDIFWKNKRIKTPATIEIKTEKEFNLITSELRKKGILKIEIEEIDDEDKIELPDIEIEEYWHNNLETKIEEL